MLGLPSSTESNKQLPKSKIFAKFGLNAATKKKIDDDISRIIIVNEILPETVNIPYGEEMKGIYVINVLLKRKECNDKTITMLSKLIPQNMIVVLQYNNECKIAVYHTKLFQTDWMEIDKPKLDIRGIDLDKAWENIVSDIGNFKLAQGKELAEQIMINDRINKLEKEIERLEKQARSEKQPKKKYEFVLEERKLKKELETLLEPNG